MVKVIFLVHKRPDLSREEFQRYWRETHSKIASNVPGLQKYIQNHAIPGPDGTDPPYDGFAEMWWNDAASLQQALESPQGRAANADLQNFTDVDRQQVFAVTQYDIVG